MPYHRHRGSRAFCRSPAGGGYAPNGGGGWVKNARSETCGGVRQRDVAYGLDLPPPPPSRFSVRFLGVTSPSPALALDLLFFLALASLLVGCRAHFQFGEGRPQGRRRAAPPLTPLSGPARTGLPSSHIARRGVLILLPRLHRSIGRLVLSTSTRAVLSFFPSPVYRVNMAAVHDITRRLIDRCQNDGTFRCSCTARFYSCMVTLARPTARRPRSTASTVHRRSIELCCCNIV
jgi:hypothetical protein